VGFGLFENFVRDTIEDMSNDIQWKRDGQDLSSGTQPAPVPVETETNTPIPQNGIGGNIGPDSLWPDDKDETTSSADAEDSAIDSPNSETKPEAPIVAESTDPVSHDADTLRAQILAGFDQEESPAETQALPVTPAEATPEVPATPTDSQEQKPEEPKRDPTLGVDQTYHSDLSSVMGSHDPKTMSELLQKARYENKRKEILSPRSKKNLMYIIGGLILLAVALVLIVSWFKKNPTVSYLNNTSVQSLVYSDKDTGINVSGLGPAKTELAIEKLLSDRMDDGELHQVYYVKEDALGNLRRMGLKDTFDQTDSQTPELLYENVAPEFMHGTYATDQNHSFIILKALSYDRALEGMKQWEPDMIDDLGVYLNLPDEAYDHSLLEDGFVDDLILNKTVRVARYVPRERDRRGIGEILDFINPFDELIPLDSADGTDGNQDETTDPFEQDDPLAGPENQNPPQVMRSLLDQWVPYAFAQSQPTSSETKMKIECYQTEQRCFGSGENDCYNVIKNKPGDQVFDESKQGLSGYQCISVVDADGGTASTDLTQQACFHPITGDRLKMSFPEDAKIINSSVASCFKSSECHRYACFVGDQEVSLDQEGNPGVNCYETLEEVPLGFEGRKICREYPGLTLLENIDGINLCFDPDGNLVPNGSTARDVTCISPLNRSSLLCLNTQNAIVPYEPFYESTYKYCFSTIAEGDLGDQFSTSNQEIRQRALALAMQLEMASLLADVLGLDNTVVSAIKNASEFFYQVGYGNILEVDAIRRGAEIAQALEQVLNALDPNRNWEHTGPNGKLNLYGILRSSIDLIKDVLGLSHNLTWVTLNGKLPLGTTIPVGSQLPEVKSIQEALTLIGILNPESVTGTFDLVSQSAIEVFQKMNKIAESGIIDPETLRIMNNIIQGAGKIYDGSQLAIINDYLSTEDEIGLGSYSSDVQSLKIFLYAEGYDVSVIDGIFDRETCLALQQYQRDNLLAVSPDGDCEVGIQTTEFINEQIREKDYLGSGFTLTTNENGLEYLQGNGTLEGIVGPGVVDFSLGTRAEARGLSEDDVVLLYTFLDEETILITTHESVIEEIIRRRALEDIFGTSN